MNIFKRRRTRTPGDGLARPAAVDRLFAADSESDEPTRHEPPADGLPNVADENEEAAHLEDTPRLNVGADGDSLDELLTEDRPRLELESVIAGEETDALPTRQDDMPGAAGLRAGETVIAEHEHGQTLVSEMLGDRDHTTEAGHDTDADDVHYEPNADIGDEQVAVNYAGTSLKEMSDTSDYRDVDMADDEPAVADDFNGTDHELAEPTSELTELRRRLDSLQRFDSATSDLQTFREVETDLTERPQMRARRQDQADQVRLWETFTPTRPKTGGSSFVGRRRVVRRIVRAIEEERSHIVLFGGRGIGKTSLSNVIAEGAREAGFHVLRYPCGSDTTFEELFRAFLSNLPVDLMDRSARGSGPHVKSFEELIPEGNFSPTDLTRALDHLVEHVILVIDEYDRVLDEDLKRKLAETIKNVSDTFCRVTFFILGIGQSLEDLLGKHPSVQRHILGVRLPLMAPDELEALIRHGEDEAGIQFDDVARDLTVTLSKGLPYYAQLIGLYAGRSALERDTRIVDVDDLRQALDTILDEMDPIMVALYDRATRGERNRFMTDVTFAAAFSRFDAYGSFTVSEAATALRTTVGTTIRELNLHSGLTQLASTRFGPILTKFELPSGIIKYSFVNPAMRQYILLRQARRRGIL